MWSVKIALTLIITRFKKKFKQWATARRETIEAPSLQDKKQLLTRTEGTGRVQKMLMLGPFGWFPTKTMFEMTLAP